MAKKLSSASFKVSVAPESGADAVTYWLVPSVTQVKRKGDGTHLPEYVSCESMVKSGGDTPVSGIGTIKFVLTYQTGGTSSEFIYSSRIIVTSDMAAISFRLYVGGVQMDEKTVLVVDDGQDGKPGDPGDPGDPGAPGKDGTFLKQIFIQADTRPDAPTGSSIPSGWAEYPEFGVLTIRGYEGEYYPNGGYRRSPKLTAHSASYRDRILFSTTNANQMITLRVIVSSEAYDHAYIGTPDTTLDVSNYFDRMSGENDRLVSQKVSQPGDHYIEILYVKDGSVNKGGDMVKYKVVHSDTVWVSSAQATYDKGSDKWVYGTWSRPSKYLADTPDMEYIFRREESTFTPESDPFVKGFIPLPFASDENYLGDFLSSAAQIVDAIYKSGEDYYRCIRARSANSGILITDEDYFKYLVPFTNDPLGVTEEYPREYMSFRKKENGKWGAFSDPKLHANYAKGEDGLPGPAGERGRMPYPAGFWNADIEYTATDDIAPIVYYEAGSTYYVMRRTATIIGVNPMEDYRDNPTTSYWIPFEKYKAIFTEILMANFAKLASAVFYGDYMFSQHGKDADGDDTTNYGLFDPTKIGQSNCPFTPNLLLDLLLGKFMGLDVDIQGGKIGDLKIEGNQLSAANPSSGIRIGTGSAGETGFGRFLQLGGDYSALISMRLDRQNPLVNGYRGINIESYGANNICLSLIANAGSKFAIDSAGPHHFYQRSGEVWDTPGVLWAGRISADGTIESSWGNGCTIDTPVYHGQAGLYAFNHDLNHMQYFVIVTAVHGNWSIGADTDKSTHQFTVRTFHKDQGYIDSPFELAVIGRNRYKEY
nr:MAG TPA: nucleoid-associated protein [Caudoviricetes sp.]